MIRLKSNPRAPQRAGLRKCNRRSPAQRGEKHVFQLDNKLSFSPAPPPHHTPPPQSPAPSFGQLLLRRAAPCSASRASANWGKGSCSPRPRAEDGWRNMRRRRGSKIGKKGGGGGKKQEEKPFFVLVETMVETRISWVLIIWMDDGQEEKKRPAPQSDDHLDVCLTSSTLFWIDTSRNWRRCRSFWGAICGGRV